MRIFFFYLLILQVSKLLAFEDPTQGVLWHVQNLWEAREISYEEYLWLQEWALSPGEFCLELSEYLEDFTIEDCESQGVQTKVLGTYSQDQYVLAQDYQSSHHHLSSRMSYRTDDSTSVWKNQKLEWQVRDLWVENARLGQFSGRELLPHFYPRPLSMTSLSTINSLNLQVNRYFQGGQIRWRKTPEPKLQKAPESKLQFQTSASYHHSTQPQAHVFQGVQWQGISMTYQASQWENIKAHYLHFSWTLDEVTILLGSGYQGVTLNSEVNRWKMHLEYFQAQNLPMTLNRTYLSTDPSESRKVTETLWRQSFDWGHLKLRHEAKVSATDTLRSYAKNQIIWSPIKAHSWQYQNRIDDLKYFKLWQHRLRLRTPILGAVWQNSLYWPRLRYQQSWQSHFPSYHWKVMMLWSQKASRESTWRVLYSLPHLKNTSLKSQIQWRFYGDLQSSDYRVRLEYKVLL